MHVSHLWLVLNCRFWFYMSGVGSSSKTDSIAAGLLNAGCLVERVNTIVLYWYLNTTVKLSADKGVALYARRKQWHPTPVLLLGKSHGRRSLVGCSPWGRRVGHWVTSLSLFTFMHWRRKWQPTPVFLPGESQGRGSLVGCHLWGCTELDTTEAT